MARNKYPEKTVALILDVSQRLFIEKGYDETSLQDIMDETNLSKGAIYHHFISKEDIFLKICDRIGKENGRKLKKILTKKELNGSEKLQEIFRTSILYTNQLEMLQMVPYLIDNPKFLVIQIKSIYDEVVPDYIEPIIEEGIKDGSIQGENPKELAEAIMVLSNVWLHPLLQATSPQETKKRCEVFRHLTGNLGFDLMNEEMTEAFVHYAELLQLNK